LQKSPPRQEAAPQQEEAVWKTTRSASVPEEGDDRDCEAARQEVTGDEPPADLANRQLDPQLLAQLRDLQEWALRSRTPGEPRPVPLPAAAEVAAGATAVEQPAAERSTSRESAAGGSATGEAAVVQPAAERPAAREAVKPATEHPAAGELADMGTAAVQPAAAHLAVVQPATAQPAAVQPASERAAADATEILSRHGSNSYTTAAAPPHAIPARRPRLWAAIAALVLLAVVDAFFVARAWREEPTTGAAASSASGSASPESRRQRVAASQEAAPSAPAAASSAVAPQPPSATQPPSTPLTPGRMAPAQPAWRPAPLSARSEPAPAPATPAPPSPGSQTAPAPAAPAQPAWRPAPPAAQPVEPPRSWGQAASLPRAASPAPRALSPGASGARRGAAARSRVEPPGAAGAIVELAPGVRPPVLMSMPPVRYPVVLQRHGVSGLLAKVLRRPTGGRRVQVAVLVNRSGRVATAEVRGGNPERDGFDRAALEAAMAARFRPATRNGVPVKMWTQLSFELTR
jgi:TonB family protein